MLARAPPRLSPLDHYRVRHSRKLLSSLPPTFDGRFLPPAAFGERSVGNLGFRGLGQILLDSGVQSYDLFTAKSKQELLTLARAKGVELNQPRGIADGDERSPSRSPSPSREDGEAWSPEVEAPTRTPISRRVRRRRFIPLPPESDDDEEVVIEKEEVAVMSPDGKKKMPSTREWPQ